MQHSSSSRSVCVARTFEEDPQESMRQLKLLLEDPDVEDGIRIGDVYGFMIEYYARTHDHNQVRSLMQMRLA